MHSWNGAKIRVFISYSSKDRTSCEELVKRLKDNLLLCQQAPLRDTDIGPGSEWQPEIRKALANADLVILLLSKNFAKSENCIEESQLVAERGKACRVFPLFLEHCDEWLRSRPHLNALQGFPHGEPPLEHASSAEQVNRWWHEATNAINRVVETAFRERLQQQTVDMEARSQRRRRRVELATVAFGALVLLLLAALSFHTVEGRVVVWPRWRDDVEIVTSGDELFANLRGDVDPATGAIPLLVKNVRSSELRLAVAHTFLFLYWLQDGTQADADDLLSTGADVERPIGVIVPTDEKNVCDVLAGLTLDAGAKLFGKRGEPRFKVVPQYDGGDPTRVAENIKEFKKNKVLAIIGSYESRVTHAVMKACGLYANDNVQNAFPLLRSECGPILTLSSARSLRPPAPPPKERQWLFRLTVDNERRAKALARAIHVDMQARSAEGNRESVAYIIYKHDVAAENEVGYAIDQAYELAKATSDWHPRLISYRRRADGGYDFVENPVLRKTNAVVVSAGGEKLDVETFEQLVAAKFSDKKNNLVAFVALDADIVKFGRALHNTKPQAASVRWYVPGPREVFEHDWGALCFGGPYLQELEGVRVISPDDSNASIESYDFVKGWNTSFPKRPPSSRAARIYDGLQVVEDAIKNIETWLAAAKIAKIERNLYRILLRDAIARAQYPGAAGTVSFDKRGDIVGSAYLMEMRNKQLRPLPIADLEDPASL